MSEPPTPSRSPRQATGRPRSTAPARAGALATGRAEGSSKVLLLADDLDAASPLARSIEEQGHVLQPIASIAEAARHQSAEGPVVLLVVLPLRGWSGDALRSALAEGGVRLPVLLLGADELVRAHMETIPHGAIEHVADLGEATHRVIAAIDREVTARREEVQRNYLRHKREASAISDGILGESEAMSKVQQLVMRIAMRTASGSTPTILIVGETGTGKGLVARWIHHESARRARPFIDINCAALPTHLIESELFGHERGAFTDAREPRAGLFESANGGTLFLDEIGTLEESASAKLLTVVEQKEIRRLGGRAARPIDVQLISATHEDIPAMIKRKAFREDLFHRLSVITIELPPLRARGDDKVLLAESFLRKFCKEYGLQPRRLSQAARQRIMQYPWPGNVRELKNRIERSVLLEDSEVVDLLHLDFDENTPTIQVNGTRDQPVVRLPREGLSLVAVEREILRQALEACEGNVSRAARFLSLSRQTLIYRMKKFHL
jgi:two-component system, NtrC family, response regulator AtoC